MILPSDASIRRSIAKLRNIKKKSNKKSSCAHRNTRNLTVSGQNLTNN